MVKVVRGQIEKTAGIRKWFKQTTDATHPSVQLNSTASQPTFMQPPMSFSPFQTTEEDNKKAAAAAVAAKLAASSSSAQMLASVLSSLVAEEAASMNGTLNSKGFTSALPTFNPEKRPRIEKSSPVTDVNSSDMASSSFFATLQQPSLTNPQLAPSANMQTMSQANNQLQAAFASAPLPPQYVQSTGFMDGGIPYGYVSNNLPPPPPPPFPPHAAIGLSMPPAHQQQQSSPGGFYRPPGIGFYGQ